MRPATLIHTNAAIRDPCDKTRTEVCGFACLADCSVSDCHLQDHFLEEDTTVHSWEALAELFRYVPLLSWCPTPIFSHWPLQLELLALNSPPPGSMDFINLNNLDYLYRLMHHDWHNRACEKPAGELLSRRNFYSA